MQLKIVPTIFLITIQALNILIIISEKTNILTMFIFAIFASIINIILFKYGNKKIFLD